MKILAILLCLIATSAVAQVSNQQALSQVGATHARTAAEITAGVTPTNYGYLPGNVRRYGADPTGVSDSTPAFTSAGSVGSFPTILVRDGTYKLLSNPTPTGTVTWFFQGGATTTGAGVLPGKIVQVGGQNGLTATQLATNGGSGACSNIAPSGHGDWNIVQTCLNYNPTEWQAYGAAAQGKAHCDNPGVTALVDWDSGTPFTSAWAGRAGFYLDSTGGPFVNGVKTVVSVGSATQLTLSTTCTGSGSVTFHFVTTTNDGFVNVSGTTVTWVSGQLFNPFVTGAGQWTINGVTYTCSSVAATTATCNTSGTLTNVVYHTDSNINDEISTFRLQKMLGTNEENLTCTARAIGLYECIPQFAGNGTLWPFFLGAGNFSFNGAQQYQIGNQANGDLTLGGNYLKNTILIPAQTGQFNENFLQIAPGLSTTGTPSPSIAVRACSACADTNLGLGFDSLGTGSYTFTSHSFANIEFQIFGVGGSSWLAVGSSASASPTLSANGAAADINIVLQAKGAGVVQATKPVQLPTFIVSGLPTCNATIKGSLAYVTDATAPTYNAALTGGGAVVVPVFCNGSAWTAH